MKKSTSVNIFIRRMRTSLVFLFISCYAIGQNVAVSGAASGNGSYPTLESAFVAINGGVQTAASITVDIVGSTTETNTAILNTGVWTKITISPSGGSSKTVSGSVTGPLIDLNGADNVIIDGLNSSGNALVISNTANGNANVSTIRLQNGATSNTITNCTVLGSSASNTLGTVFCYTSSSVGNSNNLISNCDISAAGSNYPTNGILSAGTSTAVNSSNTVSNCNISDYFNAALPSMGVLVGANNSDWIITGNRLFQSLLRTYTTANTHVGIQVASGHNYMISSNSIGYASSSATGIYEMAGTIATRFIGINLAVATTSLTSVINNTISAITLTTSSTAGTANGIICGVNITTGNAAITGNLIGGTTGVNHIVGNPSASGGMVVGIHSASTGTVDISSNYIGGLSSLGTTAAIGSAVTGIINSAGSTGLTVSTNTIGNATANNMRAGTAALTTAATDCHGIHVTTTPATGAPVVFSGNLIRNFISNGGGAAGTARGIFIAPLTGSCSYTINNNTITGIVNNNPNPSQSNGQIATAGITMSSGTANYVANNTIFNISNTSTSTVAINVCGISTALQASLPMIVYNKIYDLKSVGTGTTTTTPPQVTGVFIRSSTSSTVTIANNMISLGNGQSSDIAFVGICGNFDSNPTLTRIYYNSINIEGTVTSGAHPTFGFLRGNFAAAKTGLVDIRNNIITNNRTGGTGVHCALGNSYGFTAAATNWGAGASNYNVLNVANSANVGWWNGALSLAAWRTTTSCDQASYSGIPVTYVNSASDLHLNMGTTPTMIESHAQAITGFNDDIDGQNRPGPSGSVNGGALAPDIGADEIDGVVVDADPPAITYMPLPGTCATGDRTLAATITDLLGTPTSGSLVPTIYYKKNAGSYVSSPGVLASGSATNGVWNFTLSASAMSGVTFSDVISYFVIAQDVASPFNVISSPSVGLVAVDVNSVTTPPTNPSSYLISALSGTYTVGSGGNFTTLTNAANIYNASCLAGPVTYMLTDALYSTAETFPITFSNNIYASSTNSLLVRPAAANSATITGTSNAIIGLIGADHVKFDGSNNGSSSRNLTVVNLTTTLSTVFYAGNSSLTDAASNITINNCVITGTTGNTTTGGIIVGSGMVLGGAAEISNNNVVIRGNQFLKTQNGVFAIGNAATPDLNWDISNNICGSSVDAEKLGFRGIAVQNASLFTVNSNSVIGIKNAVTTTAMAGLLIGAAVSDGTVSHNVVSAMQNTNTTTTSGANGIVLSSSNLTCNIRVTNNMIFDIRGYGGTGVTANNNGNGIAITAGAGYKIYHNSVWLNTEQGNTALTSVPAAILITTGVSATGAIDLRNNIFVNTQTTTTNRYAIYSAQTNSVIFSNIDNNVYFTTGPNLGFISSARAGLVDIQTGFGGNLNSSTIQPVFVANNDLHLVVSSNNGINNSGTPLGVLVDIDNQTRSTTNPDPGADEFTGTGCFPQVVIAASAASVCLNSVVSFTASGASTYSWVNGPQSNTMSVTHSGATVYTVNATNSLACTSNQTVSVGVFTLPAMAIAPASATICSGSPISFTASGAPTFTWNANNTLTTTVLSVNPANNITYTVAGTSADGCVSTATVGVVTNTLPVISASPVSQTVCATGLATYTASGATTYSWNNVSGAAVFSVNPVSNAIYTVQGVNSQGCVASATVAVTTNTLPVITISPASATMCEKSSQTFTASGAVTYSWSTTVLTSTAVITASSTNVYTVTGINQQGCVSTASLAITTNSLPVVAVSPTSAVMCVNTPGIFTASGANTYSWSSGPTGNTVMITPTGNAVYSVTGTNSLTGCAMTQTFAITTLTTPVLTLSPANTATVCVNAPATYTVSGTLNYSWQGGSTSNTILIAATTNTTYTVTGTNQAGCSSTATLTINVHPLTIPTITATTFTICPQQPLTLIGSGGGTYSWSPGNGTGSTFTVNPSVTTPYVLTVTDLNGCEGTESVTVYVDACTGIGQNKLAAGALSLYPNPSNGHFVLDCPFEGIKEITVTNAAGAIILQQQTTDMTEQFDLSEKAKGMYFVNVRTGGSDTRFKVVIQ